MQTLMARAKADKPKSNSRVRSAAINMRGTPEWKAWVDRFAESERKDLVDLIDTALAEYARTRRFEIPPKR